MSSDTSSLLQQARLLASTIQVDAGDRCEWKWLNARIIGQDLNGLADALEATQAESRRAISQRFLIN